MASAMSAALIAQMQEMMQQQQMKQQQKQQQSQGGKPRIQDLSAYSLNQVQQSLDKYNKSSKRYKENSAYDMFGQEQKDYNKAEAARSKYGAANWGIEDEFRYMVGEQGFVGDKAMGMGIGPNSQQQPSGPSNPKPGDKGYSYEPTNNYFGTQGSPGGQGGQGGQGGPGGYMQGSQAGNYDYSGYNEAALLAGAADTPTSGFYNQSYGVDPKRAEQMFGHADLAGNLQAGQTGTSLLRYLDGNMSKLNEGQGAGVKGGIYETVKALAEAEEPVSLDSYPGAGGPVAKMNIPPAMVGKGGNASGIRPNRSKGSKYGRNSMGTSQFNRSNFGNSAKSSLTIGGINI
jgi:hypothetical protein